MSNAGVIEGRWNEFLSRVNHKWPQLTEADLATLDRGVDVFVSRIREKTGERRETIESFLGGLSSRPSAGDGRCAGTPRVRAAHARAVSSDGTLDRALERKTGNADVGAQDGMVAGQPCQSAAKPVDPKFGLGILVGLVAGLALRCRSAVQDV